MVSGDFKGLETRTAGAGQYTNSQIFKEAWKTCAMGVSLAPGDLTPFQYLQTFMTSFVGLADGFSDPMDFVVEDVKELERFKDAMQVVFCTDPILACPRLH